MSKKKRPAALAHRSGLEMSVILTSNTHLYFNTNLLESQVLTRKKREGHALRCGAGHKIR